MCEVQTAGPGQPFLTCNHYPSVIAASLSQRDRNSNSCQMSPSLSKLPKKKQLRMQTSWNPKDVHSISEFSVFPFPFAFLVLGRRKCPCLLIEGVFTSAGICFAFIFFSFVCLCLYTFAIEAIRRLGIYSSWCGLSILISEQYEIFISLFGKHVFPTNSWPTFWPQT